MNDLEQIKSILWHEVGHLCVDILKVQKFPKISINKLVISTAICKTNKWCGFVRLLPTEELTFEKAINNHKFLAFTLLSLTSGCVFQTSLNYSIFKFKGCFAFNKKAVGKGDHDKFYKIQSQFRRLHPELRGNIEFNTKISIIPQSIFQSNLLELDKFNLSLKEIINRETSLILKDYQKKNKPNKYEFEYEDCDLEGLILEISTLINNYGFKELIDESILGIEQLITDNIKKPNL